jgi:hypothetical protein
LLHLDVLLSRQQQSAYVRPVGVGNALALAQGISALRFMIRNLLIPP